MSVKIREKRGKLYLDIYENGRRKWEALGVNITKDKIQNKEIMDFAEICRSKRELQISEGKWGILDHLGGKMSLYNYMLNMGEKRERNDRIKQVIPYLEKYPGGQSIQIGQINSKWFINFQEYLEKDTELSPQSAASYSHAIRLALKQAVRENIIAASPAEGIKGISIPETDKDYLTIEELKHLARVNINGKLGQEVKRAFIFACYCGLRISDIKTLTWADIEHRASGAQIVKRMIKTGRKVIVPLHNSAWQIINTGKINNRAAHVFPLLADTLTDTNKYLIKWLNQAGIQKRITWHSARRTCPSLLHELGVDVYTIQKIVGHKRIQTTELYTKVSDPKLREAIDKMPNIKIIEGAAK